jgi:MFS family permease
LFGSLWLLSLSAGLLAPLLGTGAVNLGFGSLVTGAVMSGYYVGFLLGSRWAPGVLRSVGHIRVFAALAAVLAAAILGFPFLTNPVLWFLLRTTTGFAMAGLYVTAESWIQSAANNATRGRLMAAYVVLLLGGTTLGGLVLLADPAGGAGLFVLAGVFAALALVPLALTDRAAPSIADAVHTPIRNLWRKARAGLVVAAISGLTEGVVYGGLAIWGDAAGFSDSRIAALMASFTLGGVLLVLPIGHLSDHIDRREAISSTAVGAAVAVVVAGVVSGPVTLVAFALFGGLVLPHYGVAAALTADLVTGRELTGASSVLVMAYGIGAVCGPVLAGVMTSIWGSAGYLAIAAGSQVAIAVYMGWGRVRRPQLPHRAAWVPRVSRAVVVRGRLAPVDTTGQNPVVRVGTEDGG